MATAPQPTPPKPAPQPPDPKPAARQDVAHRDEGVVPPIEGGTETETPYPGEHYDTPNPYSPETIADEQRKRSDAMMATTAKAAKAKDDHKEPVPPLKK